MHKKAFNKIQYLLITKAPKSGIKNYSIRLDKKKPLHLNYTYNERINIFPLRLRTREQNPLSLLKIFLGVVDSVIKQEQEIKGM